MRCRSLFCWLLICNIIITAMMSRRRGAGAPGHWLPLSPVSHKCINHCPHARQMKNYLWLSYNYGASLSHPTPSPICAKTSLPLVPPRAAHGSCQPRKLAILLRPSMPCNQNTEENNEYHTLLYWDELRETLRTPPLRKTTSPSI